MVQDLLLFLLVLQMENVLVVVSMGSVVTVRNIVRVWDVLTTGTFRNGKMQVH